MKRFSKKLISYSLVFCILLAIFIFFMASSSFTDENGDITNEQIKISLLIAAISYIIFVIYYILYYLTSGYELKEKELICKRGVLFKKESILEYSKIHAVNKKQGLIQRLFGISTLTVDSGSTNTSHSAEIIIIEEDYIVDELMHKIKAKQNNENSEDFNEETNEEKENLYEFNSKAKLIYTFLNTLGTLIVCFIIAIFIGIFSDFLAANLEPEENMSALTFLLTGIGILMLVVLSVTLAFVIVSFIQYHDFKIYNNKNEIQINYGLLTKHQNSFKLNRVKGIRIKQGLIKRIFGFVSIDLEVIGYSNTTTQNNQNTPTIGVLIPLCKYKDIDMYLDKILPDYKPLERKNDAIKFIPFISYGLIFSLSIIGLILLSLTILLGYYGLWQILLIIVGGVLASYILVFIIIGIDRWFAYKNNSLNISDEKVTIYRGGFTREIAVVLKSNIIGIEKITTYHRNKDGIHSYLIHFKSNAQTNTIRVDNIDLNVYNELLNIMKY